MCEPHENSAFQNIDRALWAINKAAKRQRDAARIAWGEERHADKRRHLSKRDRHYELKNRVLVAAAIRGMLTLHAVHRIRKSLFACLQLGKLLFHFEISSAGEHVVVDLPDDWVSPACAKEDAMDVSSATRLLERFVAKTDDYWRSEVTVDDIVLRRHTGQRIVDKRDMPVSDYNSLRDELESIENEIRDYRLLDRELRDDFERMAIIGLACELLDRVAVCTAEQVARIDSVFDDAWSLPLAVDPDEDDCWGGEPWDEENELEEVSGLTIG